MKDRQMAPSCDDRRSVQNTSLGSHYFWACSVMNFFAKSELP